MVERSICFQDQVSTIVKELWTTIKVGSTSLQRSPNHLWNWWLLLSCCTSQSWWGGGGSYRILGTTLCFFGLSNVITYAFNMTAYILLNQYFTYIFLHCRNLFLCNIRCYSLKKQVFCELLTNEDHLAKSAQLLPQKHTSAYHMQPLYVHNAFQVEVEHPVEYVQ